MIRSDVSGISSPYIPEQLILEVHGPFHSSSDSSPDSQTIEGGFRIRPIRIASAPLDTHWSQSKQADVHSPGQGQNTATTGANSTRGIHDMNTSKHKRTSSFPLDYELFDTSGMAYLINGQKVDLNRELPPLPCVTPLHIRKGSIADSQATTSEQTQPDSLLPPLAYDPVRDGLRHGGVQRHPNQTVNWPAPYQCQQSTSSTTTADTGTAASYNSLDNYIRQLRAANAPVHGNNMPLPSTMEDPAPIMGDFIQLVNSPANSRDRDEDPSKSRRSRYV
jgi:hypothetical protein